MLIKLIALQDDKTKDVFLFFSLCVMCMCGVLQFLKLA